MADYNVNMKQWNGTSFDNVLPLAYNAKQLGGQSLAEVKQWVQDNGLFLYTGQYTGTGTYGQNNPTTLSFPFTPIFWIIPQSYKYNVDTDVYLPCLYQASMMSSSYELLRIYNSSNWFFTYAKLSNNQIQIYTSNALEQFNVQGRIYHYAAIGGYDMGGKIPVGTTFTITSSESWRVPATGRYMLELYGMGGKGWGIFGASDGASGGASCQHYDSITLIKGDIQQVIIGNSENTFTKFGTYSVNNGGNATYQTGGQGTGNRGKDGVYPAQYSTYGTGELSDKYGCGGSQNNSPCPGAVYLKYLGE